MRSRRLVLAGMVSVLLLGIGSERASASTSSTAGCSAQVTLNSRVHTASCVFAAGYDPADATSQTYEIGAGLGTAWNPTWVGPFGATVGGGVVRIEDGSGNVYATCEAEDGGCGSWSMYSGSPPAPAGTLLYCIVQGLGTVQFGCSTR